MVGMIGTIARKDFYDSEYASSLERFGGRDIDFLKEVVRHHERIGDSIDELPNFLRDLILIVKYLFRSTCMSGYNSPEYIAAKEILERRIIYKNGS